MSHAERSWADKAAELMCIGLRKPELDDTTREMLDLGVSGVLIYDLDLPDPRATFELIELIKKRAGRPLFVAVDQEGGGLSRLKKGFTQLPALAALGRTGDLGLAEEVGGVIGAELRAVGIDMILGPVLDVATNPDNPIIGERSLGRDPYLVARLSTAIVRGLQRQGVAACGKHFPGHGDTELDSNKQLPILNHRMGRLETVELVPFEAAVKARIAAMMVAHILFPALDPQHPASISRPILYGLLRQRLGYRGMVLSDDIDMGALSGRFSLQEIALGGLEAGVDCFLCARNPRSAVSLTETLATAVEDGTLLPERIEAARRRVGALIQTYARVSTGDALERVGSQRHQNIVARIG